MSPVLDSVSVSVRGEEAIHRFERDSGSRSIICSEFDAKASTVGTYCSELRWRFGSTKDSMYVCATSPDVHLALLLLDLHRFYYTTSHGPTLHPSPSATVETPLALQRDLAADHPVFCSAIFWGLGPGRAQVVLLSGPRVMGP